MSENISGTVEVVTGPNKGGFYSMKIGDKWYGLGKSRPSFEKGATVEFSYYEKDGKWPTVKGDVKLVEAKATAPTSTKQSSGGYTSAKDAYWEAKDAYEKEVVQPRIGYYAAIERALSFADIVLREKAIPGLEKAKPEARLEIIQNFVYEMADELVKRANATSAKTSAKTDVETTADAEWQE